MAIVGTLFWLAACGGEGVGKTAVVNCMPVSGAPDALLVLIGEMHGSREAPELVRGLACDISAREEVAVGLEIPSRDQPLLDAFMVSAGTASDVRALLDSEFWQRSQDGRSSAAMLKLIKDLRALRQVGRPVFLFAFDDQPGTELERNVAIANGVRRFHDAHPGQRILALMGNVHALQESTWAGDAMLTPSGKLLADLHPVSVRVSHPAGTIWACMPACGVQAVPAARGEVEPGFHKDSIVGDAFHAYRLASVTASPPAVENGKPAT